MVTDRERARELLHDLCIIGVRKTENKIIKHFAAVRAERDAEWEAKDLYTHDDMDCACENGRLEERGKWSAVAKAAYAELVGYHIKNPLPEPIKGYVCQGRVTLERLGILLGYIEPGHFTKIGTDN